MRFSNSKNAAVFIKRLLEIEGKEIELIHMDRDQKSLHIDLIEKNKEGWRIKTHHVKFSKDVFNYFGFYFKKWEGLTGETLNDQVIKRLPDDTVLYFAYQDEIRKMTLKDFKSYDLTRIAKNNQLLHHVPFDDLEIYWNDEIQKLDQFGLNELDENNEII